MKAFKYFGVILLASVVACSNEEFANYKDVNVKTYSSFTAIINETADTRVYLCDAGQKGKKRVYWNERDEIAIFSDIDPALKAFEVTSITNDNKASFQGEKVSGNKFYAYYPKSDKNLALDMDSPNIIYVSLPADNFNESENIQMPMVAISTGNTLAFKQVTGLIHFSIGGIYRLESVNLSGNNNEVLHGNGTIDLSADKPVFKLEDGQDANKSIGGNIRVGDEQLVGDGMVDVYFNLPPMTFKKGFTLNIRGYNENGKFEFYQKKITECVEIKRAEVNHYTLNNVLEECNTQGSNEIIDFVDPNVKKICVQYFDIDGDGELNYAEAAAVTEIPIIKDNYSVFTGKKSLGDNAQEILYFNEFQYFTSITVLPNYAFYGQTKLSEVTLPESLTTLSYFAFADCSSLTNIVIPSGVTSIEYYAFGGCTSLSNIVIPESVESIEGAFSGCSSLTNIMIPKGITSINNSFSFCSSLTNIQIPKSVISIEGAFSDCGSLTNIVIPESVTNIGERAFLNCSNLTSIEMPKGVMTIGKRAFMGCRNLTSIEIPESVTIIGERAFEGCRNLISIEIPKGVTTIEFQTFYCCNNLTNIVIPEGVFYIDQRSFGECSSLTNIKIPNGVTYIGIDAFYGCSSLTSIEIPESVSSIDNYAFRYCCGLKSIVIPKDVSFFGMSVFSHCTNLTNFTCMAITPPKLIDNFGIFDLNWSGTIYVPAASVEAYKSATGWSQYASQIQAIPK